MLAANTILQGRYRIVRQLGQGGMGTVYEAIDDRFESQMAIKETLFKDEALRKQFEREARLLNKLRHPAMTRVVDHFTEGDGQYLVMDFVSGEDLAAMLERQGHAFPLSSVLEWGDQLLDALNYLHSQTPPIIHRDIKPQNLKLTDHGRVILLDFGLAKGSTGQMTTVATSHSILGYSLAYAPLEQMLKVGQQWIDMLNVNHAAEVAEIQNKGTDARSDLYSLGATLLHLLTNRMPPNAPTRALSVWSGRPDPIESLFDQNIPAAVAGVLRRALALKLDDRFHSAAEMQRALDEAGRAQPSDANRQTAQPPQAAPQSTHAQGYAPTLVENTTPAAPPVQTQPPAHEIPKTVVVPQQPTPPQWDYRQPFAQPYAQPYSAYAPRKNYLPWIIGGVIGVALIVTIILIATTSSKSSASPSGAVQAWYNALKNKDATAYKRTLSKRLISQLEQQANQYGVTVDELIQQQMRNLPALPNIETTGEQINGDNATVNIKSATGQAGAITVVKENGEWKVDEL